MTLKIIDIKKKKEQEEVNINSNFLLLLTNDHLILFCEELLFY